MGTKSFMFNIRCIHLRTCATPTSLCTYTANENANSCLKWWPTWLVTCAVRSFATFVANHLRVRNVSELLYKNSRDTSFACCRCTVYSSSSLKHTIILLKHHMHLVILLFACIMVTDCVPCNNQKYFHLRCVGSSIMLLYQGHKSHRQTALHAAIIADKVTFSFLLVSNEIRVVPHMKWWRIVKHGGNISFTCNVQGCW